MTKKWQNNNKSNNNFNRRKFDDKTPKDSGCKIYVRNGDVNGAIRRLKKILERDNRQKELAKREYYEKPSVKRKRMKAAAVKRTQKEFDNAIARGDWMPTPTVGQKHLKGKRSKRKEWAVKQKVERLRGTPRK